MGDSRFAPSVLRFAANRSAAVRLFCFPSAGSTAAYFRRWTKLLPSFVEVCGIELPGHAARWREALPRDFPAAVAALLPGVAEHLDKPAVFFGHSLGGLIGFEVARRLRRSGLPEPVHFFASAVRAPHLPPSAEAISTLPQPEFRERLRRLDGTPPAILADEEAMRLFLPILRADACLFESYRCVPERPFTFPVSAFGGVSDAQVAPDELAAWREHTSAPFSLDLLPGGHFFLRSAESLFIDVFSGRLERLRRSLPML